MKTVLRIRQSNLKFRPEKTGIIWISLTLACSILKSLFRFRLNCYMSWWRWMASDCNKFVLIRSEGGGSVVKQFYALLPPMSFWWKHQVDYIETGYQNDEAVQRPPGALWLSGCKSQALMRLPASHIVVYQGCATFIIEGPNAIKQIRSRAAPSFHIGCLVVVTGIKIHFVVLHLAGGLKVAQPFRILNVTASNTVESQQANR